MQEALFGNLAASLDQFRMHERNLSGWAAKADKAKFQPIPESSRERHGQRSHDWHRIGIHRDSAINGRPAMARFSSSDTGKAASLQRQIEFYSHGASGEVLGVR